MKTILFTGDSHTWGQGAWKLVESFEPPAIAGDLRLAPFQFMGYVSLVREAINDRTGSTACDVEGEALLKVPDVTLYEKCADIGKRDFVYPIHAKIIRLEFRCQTELSKAKIHVDGKLHGTVDLQREDSRNSYKIVNIICGQDGPHELMIRSVSGNVLLYRIESYSGEYAVINSGIGSCPVEKLITDFWADYVAQVKPDIVVMEAHTINDWCRNETPEMYLKLLERLIRRVKKIGAVPIILTVSPIMGEQALPCNEAEYDRFIEMSRKAAMDQNVLLADANKAMKSLLKGLPAEQQNALLYEDIWHVNDTGHRIYAETVMDTLIGNNLV